jgi:hypothetical protein
VLALTDQEQRTRADQIQKRLGAKRLRHIAVVEGLLRRTGYELDLSAAVQTVAIDPERRRRGRQEVRHLVGRERLHDGVWNLRDLPLLERIRPHVVVRHDPVTEDPEGPSPCGDGGECAPTLDEVRQPCPRACLPVISCSLVRRTLARAPNLNSKTGFGERTRRSEGPRAPELPAGWALLWCYGLRERCAAKVAAILRAQYPRDVLIE